MPKLRKVEWDRNSLLGRPVIDSTGLKGTSDFVLTLSNSTQAEEGNGGLPIFGSLEKQLGLRLEPKKLTIDEFVIDHAEKTPGRELVHAAGRQSAREEAILKLIPSAELPDAMPLAKCAVK